MPLESVEGNDHHHGDDSDDGDDDDDADDGDEGDDVDHCFLADGGRWWV